MLSRELRWHRACSHCIGRSLGHRDESGIESRLPKHQLEGIMTAPIGYPEQFGMLLRREPSQLYAAPEAETATGFAPGKVQPPSLQASALGAQEPVREPAFADHLASFVSALDQTQKMAEDKSEEFAVGHHNDIHGTMIAVEQADISLRLLANVRNRAVDLYREVMRMGS